MNKEQALLEIVDLTVQFGGLIAVDNVSFTVRQGELLGLIGPNGAGKTTVMRSITGVVKPTAGQIKLNGRDISHLAIHQRIREGLSLSQQLVRPFRDISILDNVALAAGKTYTHSPLKALLHVSDRTERQIALQMLERVGIAHLADQMPGTQPLGILKRMEMARALALEPSLLLLDEPLAGLNSNEANTLADTITNINKQGVTVVLIEHNLTEVLRICQRLVVLDNGKKIAAGLPREVMQQPNVRAAYLGTEQSATNATTSGESAHA